MQLFLNVHICLSGKTRFTSSIRQALLFQADFFFGASFLWTTSTLPLQLRWFQEASGMRKGVLYQLNNLALLLSFLACRICIVPYLMHTYGAMKGGWSLYQVHHMTPKAVNCLENEKYERGVWSGMPHRVSLSSVKGTECTPFHNDTVS